MTSDYFSSESLISDPLHGYITFTAARKSQEPTEQTLIDHPWVQRLRRIHQLQSAWSALNPLFANSFQSNNITSRMANGFES